MKQQEKLNVSVGALIRSQRPFSSCSTSNDKKDGSVTGLAQIADLDGDDQITLMWDDPAPRPIGEQEKFYVTPLFKETRDLNREQENVPISSLGSPLPFEIEANKTDNNSSFVECENVATKKEHGDKLFQLKDPTAALQWYESALFSMSEIQVGGKVILNVGGHPTIAEVDCIEHENDGGSSGSTIDIIYAKDDGYEELNSVLFSKVLLAVYHEEAEHLQERILLNMSKCLYMLSQFDIGIDSTRKGVYARASVFACSLALCMLLPKQAVEAADKNEKSSIENLIFKCRYLRARSYIEMGRSKHAQVDMKKMVTVKSGALDKNDERMIAQLSRDIELSKRREKITNKKLTKHICSWVDQATAQSTSMEQTIAQPIDNSLASLPA